MNLRQWLPVAAAALLVSVLAAGGIALAWTLWGQRAWGSGMMSWNGIDLRPEAAMWDVASSEGAPKGRGVSMGLDIHQVPDAVDRYLDSIGLGGLVATETIEFERGFHVLVKERATGMGAMELIVDQVSGAVRPEQGPNSMWNTRYGVSGRNATRLTRPDSELAPNSIAEAEARGAAQHWLDESLPGLVVGDRGDAFYGYYTFRTYRDGELEGMLSVHGTTQQVWYHTWHGACLQSP